MLKGNSSALLYYNMYLADGIVDGFLLAPWSLCHLSTTIVCSFSGSAGQSALIIIINIINILALIIIIILTQQIPLVIFFRLTYIYLNISPKQ